jgi:hypothetical protein
MADFAVSLEADAKDPLPGVTENLSITCWRCA